MSKSTQKSMFPQFDDKESEASSLPSLSNDVWEDWGEASDTFDHIYNYVSQKNLADANEAQTRFDVIDRIIREVWCWKHGQINVEEPIIGPRYGYVDYVLCSGDYKFIVEAKKIGAAFPSVTKRL